MRQVFVRVNQQHITSDVVAGTGFDTNNLSQTIRSIENAQTKQNRVLTVFFNATFKCAVQVCFYLTKNTKRNTAQPPGAESSQLARSHVRGSVTAQRSRFFALSYPHLHRKMLLRSCPDARASQKTHRQHTLAPDRCRTIHSEKKKQCAHTLKPLHKQLALTSLPKIIACAASPTTNSSAGTAPESHARASYRLSPRLSVFSRCVERVRYRISRFVVVGGFESRPSRRPYKIRKRTRSRGTRTMFPFLAYNNRATLDIKPTLPPPHLISTGYRKHDAYH